MRKNIRSVAVAFFLILAGITEAHALVVNAWSQGNYSDTGGSDNNITAGWDAGPEFRQFSVFDLSGVTGNIASANLIIPLAANGYESKDDTEALEIYQVDSNPLDLGSVTGVAGIPIYEDLGTGVVYGSATVARTDAGTNLTIDVTAAISAMEASTGLFAFGLALTSLDRLDLGVLCVIVECQELLFFSQDDAPSLVLEEEATGIPEPATLALLLVGIVGLAYGNSVVHTRLYVDRGFARDDFRPFSVRLKSLDWNTGRLKILFRGYSHA